MDKAIAFDLETTGKERLWTDEPGTHVRIAGQVTGNSDVHLTTDIDNDLLPHLNEATILAGHNIVAYDLLALHRHHGFPTPWQLLERGVVLHDTQLTEVLLDPPEARWGSGEAARHYNLDQVAARHGFGGKPFNLKKFAKQHGGFDQIPLDNPDFLHYLRQDVIMARQLAQTQRTAMSDYVSREHRVAAIAAQITINGFRVDVAELEKRIHQGREKRQRIIKTLHEKYNLPLEDAKGKPYKSPAATKEGNLAIATAFVDAGVLMEELQLTPKQTKYDLSQDFTQQLAEAHADNEAVVALAETVQELQGVRTVYDNIVDNLAGDRVHPSVIMRQASGRWSIVDPGMTVVGKRKGRVTEREVFLAEPGEVILTVDLSQVDARAVAAFCQDPNYMALFAEGRDLWTELSQRFGITRDAVKVIGHGANYGQGPKGVVLHNPTISLEEAYRFHREREEQFPGLIRWQNEVRERAGNGELLNNGWGRLLRCNPERAYTQGPALMGQSAARDIMCHGLLRLDPALHKHLRVWVHDELVLSVPEHSAKDIKHEVEQALTFSWAPPGASVPIQIVAEASIGGRTWASAYGK